MILNIFHSGGLWLIPLVLFGAAIYCGQRAVRIHNSGQQVQDQNPNSPDFGKWRDIPGKYPYSKIGMAWFAVLLFASAVASLIVIASDYAGV